MKLPVIDGSGDLDTFDDLDRQISRSVSPISTNIRIPKSAIAGIVGDQLSTLEISKSYFSLFKSVTSYITNALLAAQYNILPCVACLLVVPFVVIVYVNLPDVKASFLKENYLVANAKSTLCSLPPSYESLKRS